MNCEGAAPGRGAAWSEITVEFGLGCDDVAVLAGLLGLQQGLMHPGDGFLDRLGRIVFADPDTDGDMDARLIGLEFCHAHGLKNLVGYRQ